MDVQSITQVNRKWIFSVGDMRDKASPEILRDIYAAALDDVKFYSRMYDEVSAHIDAAREKLQSRSCPTVDEIQKLPLWERIDAEVKREYYIRDANEISGMYDILGKAVNARAHAGKIARQAKASLEG